MKKEKSSPSGDTNMRTRFECGAREFINRWSENRWALHVTLLQLLADILKKS